MARRALAIPALACTAVLAGCSTGSKPLANPPGAVSPPETPIGRGRVDDQRNIHVACLQSAHIPVVKVGLTDLRVGAPARAATVHFEPTAGAAQLAQISDKAQGAEAIGNAELYPGNAPDGELVGIENCLQIGVVG